jgi:hypothetical protein
LWLKRFVLVQKLIGPFWRPFLALPAASVHQH